MNKFTLEQAREALKAAVDTKGRDFIYLPKNYEGAFVSGKCYYRPITVMTIPDDPRVTTGCLIGVALKILGATDTELESLEDKGANVLSQEPFQWTDETTAMYLRTAQCEQDNGKTWGEAYDIAERRLVK